MLPPSLSLSFSLSLSLSLSLPLSLSQSNQSMQGWAAAFVSSNWPPSGKLMTRALLEYLQSSAACVAWWAGIMNDVGQAFRPPPGTELLISHSEWLQILLTCTGMCPNVKMLPRCAEESQDNMHNVTNKRSIRTTPLWCVKKHLCKLFLYNKFLISCVKSQLSIKMTITDFLFVS